MKAIYEYIKENLKDGRLPGGFTFPESGEKEGVKFAPGALDGIMMYHFGGSSKESSEGIADALMSEDVCSAVKKALGDRQILFLCDALQKEAADGRLSGADIYGKAMELIKKSDSAECVKVGFALLELLKTDGSEEVKEVIDVMGASDEFTLWCCYILRHWEKGNDEIFRLAQRVDGWGRVFAVDDFLEPSAEEICRWLLCHACSDDSVFGAYTARFVYNKASVQNLLESRSPEEFDKEEIRGLSHIAIGLADEGPEPGFSALDEPEKALELIKSVLSLHGGDETVDRALKALNGYELESEDEEYLSEESDDDDFDLT